MAKTHRVSGRAVIIKDGRLLLMGFGNGKYHNFPGGGVEEGETLVECVKREVLEETGYHVEVAEMLFTLEVEPRHHGIQGDPHMSVFLRCTIKEGSGRSRPTNPDAYPDNPAITANPEWIPLEGLEGVDFLPYIPENLLEYMRTGRFTPGFLSGHFTKPDAPR